MVPTSLLSFFPSGTAVFVLRSGLGWVFESNDVHVGAFCPTKRTALRSLMQRAAMAVAMRCGGCCSALLYSLLCRSEGLPADFYAAFPRIRLCFLRAWAGCESCWMPPAGGLQGGVCVVRGQKTSSGKAALTAILPACCFILSGLHACAPGVPAGL